MRGATFDEHCPDDAWWHTQIAQAVAVRGLEPLQSVMQNVCRLVHAEGDGLPGPIADLYNGVLVVQCHTPGMHRALPTLVEAFKEALGGTLVGIYDKSAKPFSKTEASLLRWLGLGKRP